MKRLRLRVLVVLSATLALCVGAVAFQWTPVQGSGAGNAISANQFQSPGVVRVGSNDYNVVSTATILGIVPGAGHTLVATSTHTIDFGGGDTVTTEDIGLLVPVNSVGLYQVSIRSDIVGGTGQFSGATGKLSFNGRVNLATGQLEWQVHGQVN